MRGLTVNRKADTIYNTIKGTGYPLQLGTTNEVLWMSRKEIVLDPSQTFVTVVRFSDPSGAGKRVAVIPGSEVTPVTITDYKMSATAGGTGSDLNANLTIVVTWGGNTASVSLTNTAAVTGYINLLQLRGKLIRLYDPAEVVKTDSTSKLAYGDRSLSYSLPYQDNVNTVEAFSTELLAKLKDQYSTVDGLEFIANSTSTLMGYAMSLDVGLRITASETVTGIAAIDFFVNSYDLTIEAGKLTCKLGNLESVVGSTANIGIWGTNAGDSTDWGTNAADSGRWVF
jgi:hypothetical protein